VQEAASPTNGAAPSSPDVAVAPPIAEDSPEISIARSIALAQVNAPIAREVVDLDIAKTVLKARGWTTGLSDSGQPVMSKDGSAEVPIDRASLTEALGEVLMKATGRPGSGLVESGRAPGNPVNLLDEGLSSQQAFDKNRRAILERVAAAHREK
jgi:hypothetical protein